MCVWARARVGEPAKMCTIPELGSGFYTTWKNSVSQTGKRKFSNSMRRGALQPTNEIEIPLVSASPFQHSIPRFSYPLFSLFLLSHSSFSFFLSFFSSIHLLTSSFSSSSFFLRFIVRWNAASLLAQRGATFDL